LGFGFLEPVAAGLEGATKDFRIIAIGRPMAAMQNLAQYAHVKEPKMSVQQDIANFLRGNRPKPFCNDCIKKISSSQGDSRHRPLLLHLRNLIISLRNGICSDCGEDKLVTNAV
jgi:hypothetical protein